MPVQVFVETKDFSGSKNNIARKSSCSSSKTDSLITKVHKTNNDAHQEHKKNHTKKLRKNFFPHKLMDILTSTLFEDCISWDYEGKSFAITDMENFAARSNISNATFRKESFARKLNRWGFRMKKNDGNAFYSHPLFRRDEPWLCERMRCSGSTIKENTEMSSKRNFDEIGNVILSKAYHIKKRKTEDNLAYHLYDRLRKYLLRRQFRHENLNQIAYNVGGWDKGRGVGRNTNVEETMPVDNLHNTVVNNATLALLCDACF